MQNLQASRQLDIGIAPISEFVEEMVNVSGDLISKEYGVQMVMENMRVSTPVEIDMVMNEQGEMLLGSIPPSQTIETSIMPVFHKIKLNISIDRHDEK